LPLAEARLTESVKTGSRLLRKSVCKAPWSRGDSRLLVALSVSRSAIATVKLHRVAGPRPGPHELWHRPARPDVLHDCAAAGCCVSTTAFSTRRNSRAANARLDFPRGNNGCLPPGQAKKSHVGPRLPRDIVYYELPRAVIVQLPPPSAGRRYVRVASDILVIAVGTGLVIDAIPDLGRM